MRIGEIVLENIWKDFLKIIGQEAGSRVVETWLKAITILKWDFLKKTIYLQAPNSFVRDWIQSHYIDLFSLHLCRLLNVQSIEIVFVDQSKTQPQAQSQVP